MSGVLAPSFAPPLWGTPRRPERATDGPQVAAMAQALGTPLLPWQHHVADVVGEHDEQGRYFYDHVVLSVPRRAGKTALVQAKLLKRITVGRRARAAYTAQQGKDAVDLHREMGESIEDSPVLSGRYKVDNTNGREAIRCYSTLGQIRFLPPVRKTGHGRANDEVVFDEAWGVDDERGREIEVGLLPTMATRENPQVWITSAAGDLRSVWWESWVEKGRRAVDADTGRGIAAFHWGDEDGQWDDPETWLRAHPSVGSLISVDFLRGQLQTMTPEDFARAYLNRRVTSISRAITKEVWAGAYTAGKVPPGRIGLAVDVAVDRSDASIVAAGGSAERLILEVVDHRPGVAWAAERVAEVAKRQGVVPHLDAIGPAAAVADELTRMGVQFETVKTAELTAACATFEDQLGRRVFHRGDPALDVAAESAVRRQIGDGSWAWGRRASAGSISALVAATLAVRAFDHGGKPAARPRIY